MPRPKKYNTSQSVALTDYLERHRGEHFCAEELKNRLEKEGVYLGKTTVYRYLERLVASGQARKTTADAKTACYSLCDCDEVHYHLRCRVCGRLIHADCPELDRLREHFLSDHGFEIDPFGTTLSGRCADCIKKQAAEKGEEN